MTAAENREKSREASDTHLRKHWSEERAYRTGKALTRVTFLLTGVALLLNLRYAGPIEVTADILLMTCAVISEWLTRRRLPKRQFVWWPLYLGFLIAIVPSVWFSGGLYGPWLGLYLGVLAILGVVVQNHVNPTHNMLFLLAYTCAWGFVDHFFPRPNAVSYVSGFPPAFMVVATGVCIIGIGYCLSILVKTERDLTIEIENRYAELYETRANLLREESANQAKSAFLANISHELRTPLGAILGYADLLRDKNNTAAEKELFAETIERNGRQLARLVDDLLDLSKIEAGRIELERLDCDLDELVGEVVELLEVNARKKDVNLSVRALSPMPKRIVTDPVRFKQILTNVIGNAIKFTDTGAIEVKLSYIAGDSPELTVLVRDSGRGISPKELERLFKPFSQADASMTRKYGGTGLGLKFSRDLARLLGGELELSWSELGQGSEFSLTIPVGRAPHLPTDPSREGQLDLRHT